MTKKETAQKIAPWAAIVVAILGTVNAYIDSRAAKRKAVHEAEEQADEAKEWTEERAARAYQALRAKALEADGERQDLYYRLQLIGRDLDEAIELIGVEPPRSGTERRDYEAKIHRLKSRTRPEPTKPPRLPEPAPLADWDAVQRTAEPRPPGR